MATATYLLRSDRSKKVQVNVPVFGIATIVGPDGKKTEMKRAEFDSQYEPELKPANTAGVNMNRPDPSGEALDRLNAKIEALTGTLNDVKDKIDQIHSVAVPPSNSQSGGGT